VTIKDLKKLNKHDLYLLNFDDFVVPFWSLNDDVLQTNCEIQRPEYYRGTNNKIKYLNEDKSLYYVNNYGFRSDDFINKHNGKHILFAGCSVTFGQGLPLDYVWSKQLYEKIKQKEKVSGFYNLATPAATYFEIITNIFKYIKLFGNPDVIFINFPDQFRDIRYFTEEKEQNEKTRFLAFQLSYNFYNILEQYCNSNNIQLFSFSWTQFVFDSEDMIKNKRLPVLYKKTINDKFYNNFKTFYKIDPKYFLNNFIKCVEDNLDCDVLISAYDKTENDDAHYGFAYHFSWANFGYDLYNNFS